MGCDFSVALVYGVRVQGSDIPLDTWKDLDDCKWEEIAPFRLIDHGGYTSFADSDAIIGDFIEANYIDNCMDSDSILLNVSAKQYELEIEIIKDRLTELNIPFTDSGVYLVPCWA